MVKIAHEGHQGIVRTKQLLRAHVWFPGIDKMVEKHVGKCLACQATTPCYTREPLQMTDLPTGPWKKISVDFAGLFPNKEMALVFWDRYSRYPVVEFVTSTSAEAVIPQFTRVFTTYGILEEVKTDNGPHLIDRNLRNMPKSNCSGTEKSHLGGQRQMVTSNVSCRQLKSAQELLRLKGKQLDKKFKGQSATIVPHPIL